VLEEELMRVHASFDLGENPSGLTLLPKGLAVAWEGPLLVLLGEEVCAV